MLLPLNQHSATTRIYDIPDGLAALGAAVLAYERRRSENEAREYES